MGISELYGKPPGVSDAEARRTIEFCCPPTVQGGIEFYAMDATAPINLCEVSNALRWLIERGNATIGFRTLRDAHHPNLIRFEDRADAATTGMG
jgi:hypothetical protein